MPRLANTTLTRRQVTRLSWYYHGESANKLFGNQEPEPDEKIIIGAWSELSAWQIVKVYPEFMTRQIQYFSFLRAEPELVPGEGREGVGHRPAWSRKLELDQKHLEIHCFVINPKPRAFQPFNKHSTQSFALYFLFFSVCVLLSPVLVFRLAVPHQSRPLTPLTSWHLMWLLTRGLENKGPWSVCGCDPEGVSWCHGVMALSLSSRPMECRSNSWTASCQCPQWAHQAGASAPVTVGHSGSGLEFMAVTHCQQWQHPVFIAATRHSHSPGTQVHIIITTVTGEITSAIRLSPENRASF